MDDAATAFFFKRVKQHPRAEKERKRLTREERKARKREERLLRERVGGLFDGEAVETEDEGDTDLTVCTPRDGTDGTHRTHNL